MNKDNKKSKTEMEDLTNKWKRALADYQNLEKRVQNEKEEFVKFANAALLKKILPALESLEKAGTHLQDEGLNLAIRQLREGLASAGLKKIEVIGEDFDPNLMECLEVSGGPEGKVIEEIKPGYKLNDYILQVAQVKVGKKQNE